MQFAQILFSKILPRSPLFAVYPNTTHPWVQPNIQMPFGYFDTIHYKKRAYTFCSNTFELNSITFLPQILFEDSESIFVKTKKFRGLLDLTKTYLTFIHL